MIPSALKVWPEATERYAVTPNAVSIIEIMAATRLRSKRRENHKENHITTTTAMIRHSTVLMSRYVDKNEDASEDVVSATMQTTATDKSFWKLTAKKISIIATIKCNVTRNQSTHLLKVALRSKRQMQDSIVAETAEMHKMTKADNASSNRTTAIILDKMLTMKRIKKY